MRVREKNTRIQKSSGVQCARGHRLLSRSVSRRIAESGFSSSSVFPHFVKRRKKKESLHPALLSVDSQRPRFGNELKPGLETGEEP